MESFTPLNQIETSGDDAGVVCCPGYSSFFLFLLCGLTLFFVWMMVGEMERWMMMGEMEISRDGEMDEGVAVGI